MTTNIITAILVTMLQTNVVETTNERGCSTCDLVRQGYNIWHTGCANQQGVFGPPYRPATEKTVTTTVTEVRKLVFGAEFAELRQRVVSSESKRFVRSEEWKAARNPYALELNPRDLVYTNKLQFGSVTNTLIIAGPLVTNIIYTIK